MEIQELNKKIFSLIGTLLSALRAITFIERITAPKNAMTKNMFLFDTITLAVGAAEQGAEESKLFLEHCCNFAHESAMRDNQVKLNEYLLEAFKPSLN